MAETEITTRPAWVLAGASILLVGMLLLAWGQSAAAECAPAYGGGDAACAEETVWGDAG
jgi:hypothetical protein